MVIVVLEQIQTIAITITLKHLTAIITIKLVSHLIPLFY